MSKTEAWISQREASTLALLIAMIVLSVSLIDVSDDKISLSSRYIIGYYSAWLGLAYRELKILQTSIEGGMRKQWEYPALFIRFISSFIVRVVQVIPMILWMLVLNSEIMVLFYILSGCLIVCAFSLSYIEHRWLWRW